MTSMQNNHISKSDYLLTVQALDKQHQLSVGCYLKVHFIQRQQLTPKFLYSPIYNIDLAEISYKNGRLRQRLFQVVALLDHQVYHKNLEIRYRITDSNQYFIINRQTGYIASKQSLYPYTTYEFDVRENIENYFEGVNRKHLQDLWMKKRTSMTNAFPLHRYLFSFLKYRSFNTGNP
jgi:hypothetical protein